VVNDEERLQQYALVVVPPSGRMCLKKTYGIIFACALSWSLFARQLRRKRLVLSKKKVCSSRVAADKVGEAKGQKSGGRPELHSGGTAKRKLIDR
jgi:hypothetical protein